MRKPILTFRGAGIKMMLIKHAKKYKRFYASLSLVNILLFNLVIIFVGAVAYWALYRNAYAGFVNRYDNAVGELRDAYDAKHDNLYHVLVPFYEEYEDLDPVNTLAQFVDDRTDELFKTDPILVQRISAILRLVAARDRDIVGIYLYKHNTDTMYSYISGMFMKTDPPYVYPEMLARESGLRIITGARVVVESSVSRPVPVRAYGIIGSLVGIGECEQAAEVLIAYKLGSLSNIVDKSLLLDTGARFGIVTARGDVIYDSGQELDNHTPLADVEDLRTAGTGSFTLDGVSYYKNSIVSLMRGYTVFYYIPRAAVSAALRGSGLPVILFVAGFCCVSVMIFHVSLRLSSRRIGQLEYGMRKIGERNFAYRLPVDSRNDELTLVASSFNSMCDQLQQTINTVYLYNIRQREARFRSLQTSINPHFLYNTLEAVRAKLADAGNVDASEMIVMLSRLFEYQVKGETFVTIGEEIEALKLYVKFFELRYDGRFRFDIRTEEDILGYAMPKYTLQPILENYFIHGIRQGNDNHVSLTGLTREQDILITVEDDGLGIDEKSLSDIKRRLQDMADDRHSLGLLNVHQRLRYTYGAPYGIAAIESGGGKGTRVVLRIRATRMAELEEAARPPGGFLQ